MSKIKDIWKVIRGELSMRDLSKQQQISTELFNEVTSLREQLSTAQTLGEATARGDSDKIRDIAFASLAIESDERYCAWCDRNTLHYKSGACVGCGAK